MTSWLWLYACCSPGEALTALSSVRPAAAFLQVPGTVHPDIPASVHSLGSHFSFPHSPPYLPFLSPLFPFTHPTSHANSLDFEYLLRQAQPPKKKTRRGLGGVLGGTLSCAGNTQNLQQLLSLDESPEPRLPGGATLVSCQSGGSLSLPGTAPATGGWPDCKNEIDFSGMPEIHFLPQMLSSHSFHCVYRPTGFLRAAMI